MFFVQSIKSLCKNKLISGIIIVQLLVCFLTIIIAVTTLKDDLKQLNSIKSIFDEKKTIEITNNPFADVNYDDRAFQNKLYDYYCDLTKDNNISNMGLIGTGAYEYSDLQQLSLFSNGLEGNSNPVLIDENFYKYIEKGIKVSSGRKFVADDFEKKPEDKIPIIISRELNQYVKLGDIINRKYEVIGVLDRTSKLYYPNLGSVYAGVKQLSNTIIAPINYKEPTLKREVVVDFSQETFITLKSESLAKEYIGKLRKDFSDKQLPLRVNTLLEDKNKFFDSVKYGIYLTIALAVLLILFSFFGITGIILSALIKRNKEFGVKLALGWTLADIRKQILIEIVLLTTLSYVIIGVISNWLLKIMFPTGSFNVDLYTYGVTFIVVLLLTSVYSILPLGRIRKYNIVELVKDVK